MDSTNKEKELDQREKITATNIIRTGHFYFGKKRTFLNWFDTNKTFLDSSKILCYLVHQINMFCFAFYLQNRRLQVISYNSY